MTHGLPFILTRLLCTLTHALRQAALPVQHNQRGPQAVICITSKYMSTILTIFDIYLSKKNKYRSSFLLRNATKCVENHELPCKSVGRIPFIALQLIGLPPSHMLFSLQTGGERNLCSKSKLVGSEALPPVPPVPPVPPTHQLTALRQLCHLPHHSSKPKIPCTLQSRTVLWNCNLADAEQPDK